MSDLVFPYAQSLAEALAHFAWQGAVLGLIGFALLRQSWSPAARYGIGVVLLAAMAAAPVATFAWLAHRSTLAGPSGNTRVTAVPAPPPAVASIRAGANRDRTRDWDARSAAESALVTAAANEASASRSVVVWLCLWLGGVCVLSARLFGGWAAARRLARGAIRPAAPEIQAMARRIAGRLALDRIVRVVESSAVCVPTMVGWLAPVVLLPVSALMAMTPEQVEALIAHELAHVRRHDYVVNLLQSALETLLFYHPAVWWVSCEVRMAREQCCDDIAVDVCDPLVYATALAHLAAASTARSLALAATDGPLLQRVRRILGHGDRLPSPPSRWLPGVGILLLASVIGVSAMTRLYSARSTSTHAALTDGSREPALVAATRGENSARDGIVSEKIRTERIQLERQLVSGQHNYVEAASRMPVEKPRMQVAQSRPARVIEPGQMATSRDGDRLFVRWTGAFRLSDDDTDIVWIEAGKSLELTDDSWFFSTGVELVGRSDGGIDRRYWVRGFGRDYEPDGRAFLAVALAHAVRWMGFAASQRVDRLFTAGGVAAVLGEIAKLDADYVRGRYYAELLKEPALAPAEIPQVVSHAAGTLRSDYDLAALLGVALATGPGNEIVRLAVVDATMKIHGDYDRRRVLSMVIASGLTPRISAAALRAGAQLRSDYDRAEFLRSFIAGGGLTVDARSAFFQDVSAITSPYDERRVLTAAVSVPDQADAVLVGALDVSRSVKSDYERNVMLTTVMSRGQASAAVRAAELGAIGAIKSDHDRADVLVHYVEDAPLTADRSPDFFALVVAMHSGSEQRRVLTAVNARASVPEPVLAGLLTALASVHGDFDRAELLCAFARQHAATPALRPLYLAAADGIHGDYDQTRALAALVRAERTAR